MFSKKKPTQQAAPAPAPASSSAPPPSYDALLPTVAAPVQAYHVADTHAAHGAVHGIPTTANSMPANVSTDPPALQRLVNMGFQRQAAQQALAAKNGDETAAINHLLGTN